MTILPVGAPPEERFPGRPAQPADHPHQCPSRLVLPFRGTVRSRASLSIRAGDRKGHPPGAVTSKPSAPMGCLPAEFCESAQVLQEAWSVSPTSGPWAHSLPTTCHSSSLWSAGHHRGRRSAQAKYPGRKTSPVIPVSATGSGAELSALWRTLPGRPTRTLCDKAHRRDVLDAPGSRCSAVCGASSIGRTAIADVDDYGVTRLLDELAADLRAETCRLWSVHPAADLQGWLVRVSATAREETGGSGTLFVNRGRTRLSAALERERNRIIRRGFVEPCKDAFPPLAADRCC
jgi:hypothetical protein